MEKRWGHYERRPKSHYFLMMAILCAIFAFGQRYQGHWGVAAGFAGLVAYNLGLCLYARRKERNGKGTLV